MNAIRRMLLVAGLLSGLPTGTAHSLDWAWDVGPNSSATYGNACSDVSQHWTWNRQGGLSEWAPRDPGLSRNPNARVKFLRLDPNVFTIALGPDVPETWEKRQGLRGQWRLTWSARGRALGTAEVLGPRHNYGESSWWPEEHNALRQFLSQSCEATRITLARLGPDDPPIEPVNPRTDPVQRCDHLAIVPVIPRAIAGDEAAPDHWLHVANPGPGSIVFAVTGRDMAGAKGGTYRRKLTAYRSVKVKMRDIEAAFDVAEPEGWWTLTVTGSGPLYVAATMRQGDARRFVPVERPAVCGLGAVTRTGSGAPSP